MKRTVSGRRRFAVVAVICLIAFAAGIFTTIGSAKKAAAEGSASAAAEFSVDYGDDNVIDYDLSDADSAHEYVDNYADNLGADEDFGEHVAQAIDKVREDIPAYASFWALLAPIIAIVLALITKEVYSSLAIGIIVGGLIYAGGNLEIMLTHVVCDGFIANVADSYNVGILIFLVLLGTLVAMVNKSGGAAAFGKWATTRVRSRAGAQIMTIILGIIIFIDDYFNCLTVGSVMRPVTDKQNISRAKLAYLIDSTAAPICIIAPISSWAAAVAGFANGAGAENGIALFIQAIPYNFYAILTIVMMIFLAVSGLEYGSMKKHEINAMNGDLFTSGTQSQSDIESSDNPKGRVLDLLFPIIVLIIACIIGMIYSGGFFDGESFIDAFSNSDASVGLALGAFVTVVITTVYYIFRRNMSFRELMGSLPEGFKAMVSAILILCCAWTLKAMTDSLGAKIYISNLVEGSAAGFQMLLPAIIFLIAVGLSFSTGTSWGTFGILIPIVLSVFQAGNPIMIVAISACMAGAVCGDHCSPISDTTIMSSAGAQCDHMNHVSTQLPYALTVAAVSAVSYVIAGIVNDWRVVLPIAIVLMLITLFIIKKLAGKAKVEAQ
ncbi:MAG: Na+/H+ antiporter NhaC family protein [Lachnospiraceae bacterium]|nr:Na+/H+ antiporter NhaC family protein [Lachnospiraceae bacterium]